MRLSAASLLQDRIVDLYTTPIASSVFLNNDLFRRVLRIKHDRAKLFEESYDLVFLDALHSRPLKIKNNVFQTLPLQACTSFFITADTIIILLCFPGTAWRNF